jgi:flavin reductase (DIM6/NTAB) family NADH-FMN oxidoreductase RutF
LQLSALEEPVSDASSRGRGLRDALGRFATGVTIVTCRDAQGAPVGLTCNSFNSLSLEPPMVTWALNAQSPSLTSFERAGQFAVNVLRADQLDLARRFAQRHAEKFKGVALNAGRSLPVLQGALAWFECRTVAMHAYGDHVLFVGGVEAFSDFGHADDPLLFMNGKLG